MYKESQKMDDIFLYIFLVLMSMINLIFYRIYLEKDPTLFYVSVLSLVVLTLVFKVFRLDTSFSEKGIQYRFFPLHFKEKMIPWKEVQSIEIKKIRPIRDYGGFGIRYNSTGWAYIMKGTTAIDIQFKDSKKPIIIGIQNKEMVAESLKKWLPKTAFRVNVS